MTIRQLSFDLFSYVSASARIRHIGRKESRATRDSISAADGRGAEHLEVRSDGRMRSMELREIRASSVA